MPRRKGTVGLDPFQMLLVMFLLIAIPITLYAFTSSSFSEPVGQAAKKAVTGSGAPSEPHYAPLHL